MTTSGSTDALQERANELYWNSPDTVDQVAAELGLSRNVLYAAVRPLHAGADCPGCGEGLVFPNRSTRASGRAMCLSCDRTLSLDDLPPSTGTAPGTRTSEEGSGHAPGLRGFVSEPREGLRRWREELSEVEPQRAAMIGGAAALGVLFGIGAALLVRRIA
jgi:hypothetical protein